MTRAEFIENVNDWNELIDFCGNEDCDICEDIYSEECKDNEINNCLVEWAKEYTWQELYSILDDIPTGYGYYYTDDCGDWHEADDDLFDAMKQDVLEWMDDGDYWDEEDEEDDNEDVEYFDEEEWFEDEAIPSDVDTNELENLIIC